MTTVTLYDDISLIPSFWFDGFCRLADRNVIKLRFRRGNAAPIHHDERKWKSTLFEVTTGGATRIGLIDIFDRYDSINPEVLGKVDAYFKFNFNDEFIRANAGAQREKILPTGFYFPVFYGGPATWTEQLKRMRAGFGARTTTLSNRWKDALLAVREYRTLNAKHSRLEYYKDTLHGESQDLHDIFWNVNYWSPKLDDAYRSVATSNQRIEIMKMLERIAKVHPSFKLSFGFFDNADANRDYPQYVMRPTLPTRQYLGVVARSKISIVSRGLFDCISWRAGEHMAMGRFALTERPLNRTYRPLEEGAEVVHFEPDLGDLEEKMIYYLRHDEARNKIAEGAYRHFMNYGMPDIQVRYMINSLIPGALPEDLQKKESR